MDRSIILVGGGKIIYDDKYFIKTDQSISNQIMTTLLFNNTFGQCACLNA